MYLLHVFFFCPWCVFEPCVPELLMVYYYHGIVSGVLRVDLFLDPILKRKLTFFVQHVKNALFSCYKVDGNFYLLPYPSFC